MSMTYADLAASADARAWANTAAQNEYYKTQAQGASAAQALAAANQAFQNALATANASGYFGAGVGNGTVAGQPTMSNVQNTYTAFGQYYPGGFNTIAPGTPTQSAIQNQQQYGLNQANVTGVYYDPGNMTYRPGQFVRDQETGGIGQIQSNGRLQMFGDWGDFVRAGGSKEILDNPDMIRNVSGNEYRDLASNASGNFGGRGPGTASLQLQQMYGNYGLPQEGQQTLAAQNQYFNQAATEAGLTGWYNAPGASAMTGANPTPGQGQQTLQAQQQYWQQAYQQAQANQQNTQAYLTLLSNLRGPADWAKYQQVLGSTPGGMRDLYAAAMGQYIPGGGATSGQPTQAADLNTMQQQVAGITGEAGPTRYYNPQTGQNYGYGQMQSMPWTTQPGAPQTPGQTWGSGIGIGQQPQTGAQAVQATGNGTNLGGAQQQQYNLPAPNQIAAQSWNNMAPSQQQMLLGMYEANGWDKNDVQALYNQSLPKYGTNAATAGTWRMQ